MSRLAERGKSRLQTQSETRERSQGAGAWRLYAAPPSQTKRFEPRSLPPPSPAPHHHYRRGYPPSSRPPPLSIFPFWHNFTGALGDRCLWLAAIANLHFPRRCHCATHLSRRKAACLLPEQPISSTTGQRLYDLSPRAPVNTASALAVNQPPSKLPLASTSTPPGPSPPFDRHHSSRVVVLAAGQAGSSRKRLEDSTFAAVAGTHAKQDLKELALALHCTVRIDCCTVSPHTLLTWPTLRRLRNS